MLQVNSAFNGKRKMLRKSLQHICSSPETEAALSEIGLPATVSTHNIYVCIYIGLLNYSSIKCDLKS